MSENRESPAEPVESKPSEAAPPPQSVEQERLSIDEFARLDLRCAQILEAERVPGSKKLIRMQIDIGLEKRQIVAGIGKKYTPESLVGKKIIVVVNLQPARLMGVESNGMLLAATSEEGPILAGFHEDVACGSRLR